MATEDPIPASQVAGAEDVADAIATAPGDLPLAQVLARLNSRRTAFRHENTIEPPAPRPDEPVRVWAIGGEACGLDRAAVYYTTDGSTPDSASARVPMRVASMEWDAHAGYLTRWQADLPAQPNATVVRYRLGGWLAGVRDGGQARDAERPPDLWAHDGQGFWFRYPGDAGITTFAYRVEPPAPALPGWVRDAIIYQIFLDRFHPGTADGTFPEPSDPRGIHGGTLRGVLTALPYLSELGVTCLWLSPVQAAETYHRYDATDYFTVDPLLGNNEDLRALTTAAHARGMRVILDFVPSHCSWHHPAFVAAQRDRAAPTASWFTFEDWPARYRCFLDMIPSLPSLATGDAGARAHLIAAAVLWLREYGVDGFRLDHAIGPSMDFWVAFRAATRAAAPECFTVGEVTDTPDCMRRYRGRLDAILDFPLARALRHTFALEDWSLGALDNFLQAYSQYMADGPGRVSFLDNHDMDRFLILAHNDPDRLKLAALCQFTLEPPPIIYYGTEIGLSQRAPIAAIGYGGDAEARRDMPWDPAQWNQDLLAFYTALIHLRRTQPALRQGVRRTVHLDAADGVYAYLRTPAEAHARSLLVAFNLAHEPRTLILPGLQMHVECLHAAGPAPVIRAEERALTLEMAPRSGAVLA